VEPSTSSRDGGGPFPARAQVPTSVRSTGVTGSPSLITGLGRWTVRCTSRPVGGSSRREWAMMMTALSYDGLDRPHSRAALVWLSRTESAPSQRTAARSSISTVTGVPVRRYNGRHNGNPQTVVASSPCRPVGNVQPSYVVIGEQAMLGLREYGQSCFTSGAHASQSSQLRCLCRASPRDLWMRLVRSSRLGQPAQDHAGAARPYLAGWLPRDLGQVALTWRGGADLVVRSSRCRGARRTRRVPPRRASCLCEAPPASRSTPPVARRGRTR
jgi:hypothetical protein